MDIRETDYVDGFDVFQCRTAAAPAVDTCPNAHGLDQNIYGQSLTLPAADADQRPAGQALGTAARVSPAGGSTAGDGGSSVRRLPSAASPP